LDVWSEHLNDVMVPPQHADLFAKVGLEYDIFVSDVQQLIDNVSSLNSPDQQDFFTAYHSYEEVVAWLNFQVSQYPSLLSIFSIGKTVQGRDIWGVRITGPGNPNSKPGIIYNSMQHAREWVSVSTLCFIIDKFVSLYNTDPTIKSLVDQIEWTIIPIVNADGYIYSWTNDRMWRKNRRLDAMTGCYGVDTNRNWAFRWNNGGSSTNPCADTYHGPSPGSEPENTAVANFVGAKPNTQGYIDFHSYSQLWMCPWGWSTGLPADYNEQYALMERSTDEVRRVGSRNYEIGSVANTIYIASGGSLDWTYGQAGVLYSYAVELRDTGQYGFVLPPAQIKPQGEEILAGVIAMGQHILGA